MADERWTERPLACVVVEEGSEPTVDDLQQFLRARVPRWCVPEEFVYIDEVPKTRSAASSGTIADRRRAGSTS